MSRKSNEAPREAAQLPVARFAALAGTPERTFCRHLAARAHAPAEGRWPTPAVGAAETLADRLQRVRDHWRWDRAHLRGHRLRRQVLPGRHDHPDRAAAPTRSPACTPPSQKPNASPASTTSERPAVSSNSPTRPQARSSTSSGPDRRRVRQRLLLPWRDPPGHLRRKRPAAVPGSHPRPLPADQRRHRTRLRHTQVRALVSGTDRRRRKARDGDRPLPRHLRPHPTPPVARRSDPTRGLRRRPVRHPVQRSITATLDRAGLAGRVAAEGSVGHLPRRRVCRWRFLNRYCCGRRGAAAR